MVSPAANVHWHVELRAVQKTYDGATLVVDGVDLKVAPGEFLTLLGPSGSGKTTILMMLAGFEVPTAGQILLDGRDISRLPPHQRDIGVVFQDYALFPHLSVAENIGFPLRVRKRPADEVAHRVDEMLEMVRLDGLGARRPSQLSGGQKQRVALARALVFSPKLVLMDEPLGALDKQLREQMQLEIKRLHAALDLTVVYVTHDQSEALTMSDRVAVLDAGRIRQLAPPAEMYRAPIDPFVAQFIGENNLLPATILEADGPHTRVQLAEVGAVTGYAVVSGEPGAAVSLAVRPEHVLLGDPARQRENHFEGTVTECIYHGDHTRVRVSLAGARTVVAKVAGAGTGLTPGDETAVGWSRADCRVLSALDADPAPGVEPPPASRD